MRDADLSGRIAANIASIREAIARACRRSKRDPREVRIVAAAKTVGADAIAAARDAGVPDVGENYVSELRARHAEVGGVAWHFIGTLQSGSAHHVAELADVVHGVMPGRAAERFARRAASTGRLVPVMIEVDFAGRGTGVAPDGVTEAADRLSRLEGCDLVGPVTLPPPPAVPDGARPCFALLRDLLRDLSDHRPSMRELSMGMSLDYEVAVEEGATMVRIGQALFGARPQVDTGRT